MTAAMATADEGSPDYYRRLPGGFGRTTWIVLILLAAYVGYYFVYGFVEYPWYEGIGTTIIIALCFWLLYSVTGVNILRAFHRKNIFKWTVPIIVGYIAFGAAYSILRVNESAADWRGRYDAHIAKWAKDNSVTLTTDKETGVQQVPSDKVADWRKYYQPRIGETPSFLSANWQIKKWFGQWPWSAPDYILRQWILKLFDRIVDSMGRIYATVIEWHTRGTQ